MILFLQILGGIAALALGLWLGAGRYTQTLEDVEARMDGTGTRQRAKRHFMWLNYFKTQPRRSERGPGPDRFKMAVTRDRKDRT